MSLKDQFGKDVLLTGWGHSRFGKLTDETLESLIVQVATEAIGNAGIEAGQIDEIYLGQFNSGMMPLAFPSSLALQVSDQLANVPSTRVENACASGSAAFQQGTKSLLAGTAKTVLVIGAEKMTQAGADVVGAALLGADYDMAGKASTTGFTGLFAEVAKHYGKRYGYGNGKLGDVLGTIAAKNHRNGVDNPYAQLRKDLGEEFCRTVSDKNPMVADPLRRTDCSPVSDGAAAVVLSVAPTGGATAPVRLAGFGQANDFFPAERRDPTEFAATRASWQRALGMAGVGLEELDFAEVHDCFTIAELLMYEAMGLTERGQGARALEEGWVFKDGKLPVNVSGGLKAKGHPVGATGVSQHVIAAMQLTGTAGAHAVGQPAPGSGAEHGRRGHRQLRQRARSRLESNEGADTAHLPAGMGCICPAFVFPRLRGRPSARLNSFPAHPPQMRGAPMRATIIHGPGDIRVEDRDYPTLQLPTDVIVKVTASCVCGSDLWPYRGVKPTHKPSAIGHEFIGTVESIGEDVKDLAVGDFVIAPFVVSCGECPQCLERRHGRLRPPRRLGRQG